MAILTPDIDRERGDWQAEDFTVILLRRKRQSKVGRFRIEYNGGLWGVGAAPSCLVPGPRVMRTSE